MRQSISYLLKAGSIKGLLPATILAGLFSGQAAAIDMGLYIDFSGGSGSYEWDSSALEIDFDMRTSAFGFALDTAAMDESWFNYRLNVGLEGQVFDEDEQDGEATTDVNGFTVENVFGFAIKSTPRLRWWAGPLLRFGAYHGDSDTYFVFATPFKTELDLVESGIGLVTGVNLKVANNLTLAPSLGVRSINAAGTVAIVNQDTGATIIDEDLSGHSTNLFVNFALLF